MNEADLRDLIRDVIRQELTPILMGRTVSNKDSFRSSIQRFTEGAINNIRSIQPYGIRSRAPAGTQSLIIPVAGDATHLLQVGHFDESAPTVLDGESILYNQFGQSVYLSNGKIQIGSKAADQNLVLGQVFKAFMAELLQLIHDHTHPGIGYPPSNMADFAALKASPIEDEAILSDENFTEKGG